MHDLSPHYNREGDTLLIELRLDHVMQLFNSLDPTPFHSRDLDADAEAYIVGAARELTLGTPLKLVLYLPPAAVDELQVGALQAAIQHYFQYQAGVAERQRRLKLRQGRLSLLIGLLFLGFCMSLIGLLNTREQTAWVDLLQEGLLISGWVALWGPLEIFLYGWWPIYQMQRVYAKLGTIPVEVRAADSTETERYPTN